ncbi:MAG: alpha/beta hydrolase [Desulfuromonadales bacterium]|nr:alpha/beta hydrolase [Desulfuromonadales bacterium]
MSNNRRTAWFTVMALFILCWGMPASATEEEPYFFPFVNPYAATVMETPQAFQAEFPPRVPVREFSIQPFPQREIPQVFWYLDKLTCSLVAQKGRAPLVFIIAGTGARHNSPKMLNLQRIFFKAGFHIISISSPTTVDFVVTASASMMPGNLQADAQDLYRVMLLAWGQVKNDIEVSRFALTGYSLGAIQAAFVAQIDDREKVFNFKKVLLINPPANLYRSVSRLDQLLLADVPGGTKRIDQYVHNVMSKLAETREDLGTPELSSEYLYRASRRFPPREDFLKTLVGLAFRLDSTSMMFAADSMHGGGFVIPKGTRITNSTSLSGYFSTYFDTGFVDYFDQYFSPYWQQQEPGLTEQQLIDRLSLKQIAPYLKSATQISLIHNEDDIILAPGDLDELLGIFGGRAQIYPTGGHCGNMNHPVVVRYITRLFQQEEK